MRTFVASLFTVIFFLLHTFLAPNIQILTAMPDFILILVVIIAFFSKSFLTPVMIALVLGIALDTTTAIGTYTNTGIYLMIAVAFGLLANKLECNLPTVLISVLVAGVFKYFILIFALLILRIESTVNFLVIIAGLPSVVYCVILSIPFYYLFTPLYSMYYMTKEGRTTSYIIGGGK